MVFLVLDLAKLKTKSKACNILVLKCLGHVEFNRVMIMTPESITKLRLVWHNALAKDSLESFLSFSFPFI
jgi:hypothetical protein